MLGGVGLDLGAVESHVAQADEFHRLRDQQHLHHQAFNLRQKALTEGVEGVVIRVFVGRDIAERHRVVGGALQFAAPEHARGVAVDQGRQQ